MITINKLEANNLLMIIVGVLLPQQLKYKQFRPRRQRTRSVALIWGKIITTNSAAANSLLQFVEAPKHENVN